LCVGLALGNLLLEAVPVGYPTSAADIPVTDGFDVAESVVMGTIIFSSEWLKQNKESGND
jgi:hypothetical protein